MLIGSLGLHAARFGAAGATRHAPPPPWLSPKDGGGEGGGLARLASYSLRSFLYGIANFF